MLWMVVQNQNFGGKISTYLTRRQEIAMRILSNIKGFAAVAIATLAFAGVFAASTVLTHPAEADSIDFDCDSNAVVWCGAASPSALEAKVHSGDGHNSATSIQNIYDGFGISASEINAMGTDSENGTVTKTGDVYVGTTLVATNALTAGREDIAGSTKHVVNGTTYYSRPPSVSFLGSSLPAMVVMQNGVFKYAIMNSCGNPVIATAKKPGYSILKTVHQNGSSAAYGPSVTVNSGTDVQYRITVRSTGAVAADNILVKDALPAGETYVAGSMQEDGKLVSDPTRLFAGGITIASLNPGVATTYQFVATTGVSATSLSCKATTVKNVANISAPGMATVTGTATVTTRCTPPTYTCSALTASLVSGMEYKFSASAATTNGATVTGYAFNYGNGVTKTISTSGLSTSIDYTYPTAGTFKAIVTALFDVDGVSKTATSPACTVTVKPTAPPTPVIQTASCKALTDTQLSRDEYSFSTATTTINGATITGYTYSYGDGKTDTNVPTATVTHAYDAPGNYNVNVAVNATVNGKATTFSSPACAVQVTVAPQPTAECTGLIATPGTDNTVSVTATDSLENGATLTNASFNFGDQTAPVSGTSLTASHTYAAAGTYTIVGTLTFANTAQTTSTCQAVVTFTAPQPIYTCDEFTVSSGTDNDVTVTNFADTVENGATFSNLVINWGDNSAPTPATTPIGTTHTYAASGTYVITAVAHFNVNGQDVTAGGASCQATVPVNAPTCTTGQTGTYPNCVTPVTPTTPTTPTPTATYVAPVSLINTGPGNVVAGFVAISVLGAFGYRWFLKRQLS
jgi:uncharacterized repeat protein (TIGR01451 family)